jgi:hypothetical protein
MGPPQGKVTQPSAPTSRSPQWRAILFPALAAAIILVAIGVGLWWRFGANQPTSRYAMAGTTVQPAIAGTLEYFAAGSRLELDVHGLKPLPSNQVYELWLIRGYYNVTRGTGTFRPSSSGTAHLSVRGENVSNYTLACLTVEQAPRAQRPTLPLVATAEIDR